MSSTDGKIGLPDEAGRLAAVRRYAILDTPPDGAFDRITRLAARIFDVPISIVSVVDHDRIWFKSRHGIDAEQISREPGLCASAILQDGPWVVTDAELDPRTLENPLVRGELGLRFYAGVPLRTSDGYNLGTLSVIDTEPRELSEDELATLEELAAIVVDEIELRLTARNEKQELVQTRADFVAIASHELRTPLAAVYGAAKLLQQADLRDEKGCRKLLAVIAEESEQLAAIVGELLTGAQLEAGNVRLVFERCRPQALAESALAAARAHLPGNLSLRLAAGRDLPTIESDAARVKQILAGLLDNAVKYSPGGGRIDLTVSRHDGGVRFRVTDQGIGIPREQRQRIFERFVRVDPEQTNGVGGTGLGLYVARELARQLGGTVDYDLDADPGSSFGLDLPSRHPSTQAPTAHSSR